MLFKKIKFILLGLKFIIAWNEITAIVIEHLYVLLIQVRDNKCLLLLPRNGNNVYGVFFRTILDFKSSNWSLYRARNGYNNSFK